MEANKSITSSRILFFSYLNILFLTAAAILISLTEASADITAASTQYGSIGTKVEITGTQFGNTAGNVTLRKNGKKNFELKVVSWSDNLIVAAIKTGKEGEYQLLVTGENIPKKGFILGSSFYITDPLVSDIQPPLAYTGQEVTLIGEFFGPDKGQVRVNNKAYAKIVEWTKNQVRFIVPFGTQWNASSVVWIKNKVGTTHVFAPIPQETKDAMEGTYEELVEQGFPEMASTCVYLMHATSKTCKPDKDVQVEMLGYDGQDGLFCVFTYPPIECFNSVASEFQFQTGICQKPYACVYNYVLGYKMVIPFYYD